jgi:hypothetical protein
MMFIARSLVILVFLLSLAGTAFAQYRPVKVPEIDVGSAVSAIALLMGGWALLGERLRSK